MPHLINFEYGKRAFEAKDYEKALNVLKPLAELGHAAAQRLIGNLYLYGKGTEQNIIEGIEWYKKASDQGDPLASHELGLIYDPSQNRPGLPRNEPKTDEALARKYYKKAFAVYLRLAEGGDPEAQHNVAMYYLTGFGELPDREKALVWYTKAAENGNPYSCAQLAYLYFDPDCKSNEEAKRWYRKGIELGRKVFHIPALEEDSP